MTILSTQAKPLTQEELEARLRKNCKVEIKLIQKNNTLAAATIKLNLPMVGVVSIRGFLIFRSSTTNKLLKENINITPPSVNFNGKYIRQIFFDKVETWTLLQKIIFETYVANKEEQLKKNPI